MNIALDSIALLGPMSKNRGIGNYAKSQFTKLIEKDSGNKYYFFNIFDDQDVLGQEKNSNFTENDFLCVKEGCFFDVPGFEKCYGELVKKYIKKNDIDVFYITSPFDNHIPLYKQEWMKETTVVATVYDIIPYVMKDHYFPHKGDIDWYMERINMLRWVDRLLVISQSVKDDLVNYLKFDPEKIDVIWGAPSEIFRKIDVSPCEEKTIRDKYHIVDSFIMCTGGDDERKNIAGLIEAYSKMSSDLIHQYQLVIVCKLQRASVDRYTNMAVEKGIKDRVILTNFVSDEDLVCLYNLADLVVFPSVYEGFGLPVVEAWACGTGVLTSNNSSLGQIAGEAAITVNPHSIPDIRDGLEKALRSDLLQLAKMGEDRLHLFTWDNVAEETRKSIAHAYQGKKEIKKKDTERSSRSRIAFFTPLPPLESGISDYSVDIIMSLKEYFDIDVYIDDDYTPNCFFEEHVRILPHKKYTSNKKIYLETVFQVGNSLFHDYMWQYIKKDGGLVVLHDYNMHGVLQAKYLGVQNKPDEYQKALKEDLNHQDYEKCVKVIGNWTRLDALRTKIELNGFLVNYANKVIVHSDEAKKKLLEKNIGRSVRRIRHYAKIEPLIDTGKAKEELGISAEKIVLAAFGGIHETKRVLPILQAFAKIVGEFENVQLVFGGKLDDSIKKKFKETLEELDIQNNVTVTGYQDLNTFLRYMDATDVCLNLRWPYNGETSGSLMRMLAKGKCIIVNDIGSFSEIPDEAVIKLPSAEKLTNEQEVLNIYEALKKLCEDTALRKKISMNARRFAETELDITIISKQYRDYILETASNNVNEDLLQALREKTVNLHMNKQEIYELAHTLSYIM